MTAKQTIQTAKVIKKSNSYGGIIEQEDFSTCSPNKWRITNQAQADNFQKVLEDQKRQKDKEEILKNMTFEELRLNKIISSSDGRPSPTLTDEKWQEEFAVRKLFITPYDKSVKKLGRHYSIESGTWNEKTRGLYYGPTNWQEICAHINDILRNIRSGQVDYCYFIYNVMELAKFHFDDLRTKYCNGYWKVWLERE